MIRHPSTAPGRRELFAAKLTSGLPAVSIPVSDGRLPESGKSFPARRSAPALLLLTLLACSGRHEKVGSIHGLKAPETFRVTFDTTKGTFVLEVVRAWAPLGADRFYTLIQDHFFDGVRFFRVVPEFVVQFGINGDAAVEKRWIDAKISDDPVKHSNTRGTIAFATDGPDTRTTQVFINLADTPRLDPRGFAPFGQVISGMDVIDRLYRGYGEGAPIGSGPSQPRMESEGNAYLDKEFPKLDAIRKATLAP